MRSEPAESRSVLVLVHTVAPLIDEFACWCAAMVPNVRIFHVLDEPLIERIHRQGVASDVDAQRLLDHLKYAEQFGADVVLVTCSTVSLLVDSVRGHVAVPVVTIDEAMATEAAGTGPRITLIATNETTLEPSATLILAEASLAGRDVAVEAIVVPEALRALLDGDESTHDRLVAQAIAEAGPRSDVVVLAQASMARVMEAISRSGTTVPVLTSPQFALAEVARVLAAAGKAVPLEAVSVQAEGLAG